MHAPEITASATKKSQNAKDADNPAKGAMHKGRGLLSGRNMFSILTQHAYNQNQRSVLHVLREPITVIRSNQNVELASIKTNVVFPQVQLRNDEVWSLKTKNVPDAYAKHSSVI